jgi:hypothetical protein
VTQTLPQPTNGNEWGQYPIDNCCAFTANSDKEMRAVWLAALGTVCKLNEWLSEQAEELLDSETDPQFDSFSKRDVRAYIAAAIGFCFASCTDEMSEQNLSDLFYEAVVNQEHPNPFGAVGFAALAQMKKAASQAAAEALCPSAHQ